jgi:hypothetical protein
VRESHKWFAALLLVLGGFLALLYALSLGANGSTPVRLLGLSISVCMVACGLTAMIRGRLQWTAALLVTAAPITLAGAQFVWTFRDGRADFLDPELIARHFNPVYAVSSTLFIVAVHLKTDRAGLSRQS